MVKFLMWWQWSLFRSDAILMFLGQTLLPLLMRLFGLNHRWWCFLDFWFFMFLDGFHVFMFFSGFFHSWIYHRQLCDSFANLSGPIFLPFFEVYWPSYAIICDGRHTSVQRCDVSFKSIPIYVDDLFADHQCLSSGFLPIPIDMISAFTMPSVLIISKH